MLFVLFSQTKTLNWKKTFIIIIIIITIII